MICRKVEMSWDFDMIWKRWFYGFFFMFMNIFQQNSWKNSFFQENIRKILLFEVIETFYFVGNGEKGHQNEYEIYEMKVCPCENDLIMGPNF